MRRLLSKKIVPRIYWTVSPRKGVNSSYSDRLMSRSAFRQHLQRPFVFFNGGELVALV